MMTFREFANGHPVQSYDKDGDYFFKWMQKNWEFICNYDFLNYPHTAIVFSKIITKLCQEIADGDGTKMPIVMAWLLENRKCPFGFTLKVKAYKILSRQLGMLDWTDHAKLVSLQEVANKMPYRPREFLHLDKLLIKLQASLTSR